MEKTAHLRKFLKGLREDERDQIKILNSVKSQVISLNLENSDPDCNYCHGRGFEGYNRSTKKLIICRRRCFNEDR